MKQKYIAAIQKMRYHREKFLHGGTRYGWKEKGVSELWTQNEATVYWVEALQMRHELEQAGRFLYAVPEYGVWLGTCSQWEKGEAASIDKKKR